MTQYAKYILFLILFLNIKEVALAEKVYPGLVWGTYVGRGKVVQEAYTYTVKNSVVDKQGNLYIVGKCTTAPLLEKNVSKDTLRNGNAFIARFNDSSMLMWCKVLGSDSLDFATTVIVNSQGNIFVSGITLDTKGSKIPFPVKNKPGSYFQADSGGMFICEFSPDGDLLWSTRFGGLSSSNTYMKPLSMQITSDNKLFISGEVGFDVLPSDVNAVQFFQVFKTNPNAYAKPLPISRFTGFILGFSPISDIEKELGSTVGGKLFWSTSTGGEGLDRVMQMSLTQQGDIYLMGEAQSGEFPSENVNNGKNFSYYQNKKIADMSSVFLSIFDTSGFRKHSTLIDGSSVDNFGYFTIDTFGNLWVSGQSSSANFPQKIKEGSYNASAPGGASMPYLMQFDNKGNLLWSTFLDKINGNPAFLLVAPTGHIYLSSRSNKTIMPLVAHPHGIKQNRDATYAYTPYFSLFSPQGEILWNTYFPISSIRLTELNEISYAPTFEDKNLYVRLWEGNAKQGGALYFVGNTAAMRSDIFTFPDSLSSMAKSPYFDSLMLGNGDLAGHIVKMSLCDNPKYTISLGPSSSICKEEVHTLSLPEVYSTYSVQWCHKSLGLPWSTDTIWNIWNKNTQYSYTKAGKYMAILKSPYRGCPDLYTDTVNIDTIAIPLVKFPSSDTTICSQEVWEYTLMGERASYAWYKWENGVKKFVLLSQDSTIKAMDSGIYVGSVSNLCGQSSDTIHIHYYDPFITNISLGADTVLCFNDSLFLDVSTPLAYRYLWENGDTIPFRYIKADKEMEQDPLLSHSYRISIQSRCVPNPYFYDTISIRYVYPPTFSLPLDTILCPYEILVLGPLDPIYVEQDVKYLWSNGNTTPTLEVKENGEYSLEIINFCGDANIDSIHVQFVDPAMTNIRLPDDSTFCEKISLTLDGRNPFQSISYQWEDDATEISGVRTFTKGGEFVFSITDTFGCIQTKTIGLKQENCDPQLEAPNVFTPNNDGVNDVFKFKTVKKVFDFSLWIVNVNGKQVLKYQGSAEDFVWDGNIKGQGKELPDGAYFYICTYRDIYGKKHKQNGSITLLR